MSQRPRAEVLEPGNILGHHVEFDDVPPRLVRRSQGHVDAFHFAGFEVARQVGAAVIPGNTEPRASV